MCPKPCYIELAQVAGGVSITATLTNGTERVLQLAQRTNVRVYRDEPSGHVKVYREVLAFAKQVATMIGCEIEYNIVEDGNKIVEVDWRLSDMQDMGRRYSARPETFPW